MTVKYNIYKRRPEIDGLRAFAVISVFFYHAGNSFFGNGYIGVDIFFTISGFVITQSVIRAQLEQSFKLIDFFERRARRIVPAFYFWLIIAAFLAWLFVPPKTSGITMESFSNSLLYSLFFGSNLYFWDFVNYYSQEVFLVPLIHTWSLSVEMQFYLTIPLLFVGLRQVIATFPSTKKYYYAMLFLSIASILYISLDIKLSTNDHDSFYFLTSRLFEFMFGSLAAIFLFLIGNRTNNIFPYVHEGLAFISFVTIAVSISPSNFLEISKVGRILAANIGTAVFIVFSYKGSFVGRALSNKVLVSIGLISFSFYISHQIFLAIVASYTGAKLVGVNQLIAFFSILLLSYLSWKFVELPFLRRNFISNKFFILKVIIIAVSLYQVHVLLKTHSSFQGRYSIPESFIESLAVNPSKCFVPEKNKGLEIAGCHVGKKQPKPRIIFFGDSHAEALLPAFHHASEKLGIAGIVTGYPGCLPFLGLVSLRHDQDMYNCKELNQRVLNFVKEYEVPILVLAARWTYYTDGGYPDQNMWSFVSQDKDGEKNKENSRKSFVFGLKKTLEQYQALGVSVFIVSQTPQQKLQPVHIYAKTKVLPFSSIKEMSISYEDHLDLQNFVETAFNKQDVRLIKIDEVLCSEGYCDVGNLSISYYSDDDHLNLHGNSLLYPLFEKELSLDR